MILIHDDKNIFPILILSIPDETIERRPNSWINNRKQGDVMNSLFFNTNKNRHIDLGVKIYVRRAFQLNIWQSMNRFIRN